MTRTFPDLLRRHLPIPTWGAEYSSEPVALMRQGKSKADILTISISWFRTRGIKDPMGRVRI